MHPREWQACTAKPVLKEVAAAIRWYNATRITLSRGGNSPIACRKSLRPYAIKPVPVLSAFPPGHVLVEINSRQCVMTVAIWQNASLEITTRAPLKAAPPMAIFAHLLAPEYRHQVADQDRILACREFRCMLQQARPQTFSMISPAGAATFPPCPPPPNTRFAPKELGQLLRGEVMPNSGSKSSATR